jgi:hypothetical protein
VPFSRLRIYYDTPFKDSIFHAILHNLGHMAKALVAKGSTKKPFSNHVGKQRLEKWVVLAFEELN